LLRTLSSSATAYRIAASAKVARISTTEISAGNVNSMVIFMTSTSFRDTGREAPLPGYTNRTHPSVEGRESGWCFSNLRSPLFDLTGMAADDGGPAIIGPVQMNWACIHAEWCMQALGAFEISESRRFAPSR
jgi:hypothetical protein